MPSKLQISMIVKKFDKKLDRIIHEDLPILEKVKNHVISSGGKRIRPLTHFFLCQLLGYEGNLCYDVGAIAELIHGASLLHDDVVDGAETRRGYPTVGKLHGNKTAILSGDYLLACGIDHLNKLNQPLIMSSYTGVIRDLSVGELIQMEWEKNPKITLKIYEKVIYGKTASLFGAVCETAGILSKKDEKEVKEIKKFGITMGMLFQKKDDYIDYFEAPEKSGKIQLKDFMNGLYTYPILLLLEKANRFEKKQIHELLKIEVKKEKDLNEIMELMDKYKISTDILSDLNKDVSYLLNFLKKFESGSYRDLMIERIEGIIN